METLTFVSLMSDNARAFHASVAGYVRRRVGIRTSFVDDVDWQERERMLDDGRAQIGFICGLLYTRKVERLELLGAPVMRDARYQGRPVYYSDVVVRSDSPYQEFSDLREARWGYNDPGSFSGYAALRARLAALGATAAFCGSMVESGAHTQSLRLVLDGQADAASIDSTVLDMERAREPELAERVRVIESIGPSPIPPVVVRRELPNTLKRGLRDALLQMHEDEQGAAILSAGMAARFVPAHDADYDDIRRKAGLAEQVKIDTPPRHQDPNSTTVVAKRM
jgi:phosphonate transport system substrate-binding protein